MKAEEVLIRGPNKHVCDLTLPQLGFLAAHGLQKLHTEQA